MTDPWAFGWNQLLTIAGFVITSIIALGGFRTFGRWKREKIEERRIEVALDALAIAYEAGFRFEAIRSRIFFDHEYEGIDEVTSGEVRYHVGHRKEQRGPYAALKRMRNSDEFFERVYEIEPKFMAVFGAETQGYFDLLHEAKTVVESSAHALYEEGQIEHDPSDTATRERLRKLRVDVYASKGEIEADDRVGQNLAEFQMRIEGLCRPIVDSTFGRKGSVRRPRKDK